MFNKLLRLQLKTLLFKNTKHAQLPNLKFNGNAFHVAALNSSAIHSSTPHAQLDSFYVNNLFRRGEKYCTLPIKKHCAGSYDRRLYSSQNGQSEINKSSSEKSKEEEEDPIIAMYDEKGNKLSNWARMKMMAKAYGYVVIPVHWVIAPVWFGSFYLAVKHGIDIVPVLKSIGVSDVYLNKLQNSGASDLLQAYAMYKVATPARYTVTLGATEMTIRALRKHGFMKPLPPKEKSYRESMQETYAGMKERMEDVKEDVKEKMDDVKDKMTEVREKLKDGETDKGK